MPTLVGSRSPSLGEIHAALVNVGELAAALTHDLAATRVELASVRGELSRCVALLAPTAVSVASLERRQVEIEDRVERLEAEAAQ